MNVEYAVVMDPCALMVDWIPVLQIVKVMMEKSLTQIVKVVVLTHQAVVTANAVALTTVVLCA
jgi:hypothetical protein